MLVVLIAVAVSLKLMIERLFRHLADNYELEWGEEQRLPLRKHASPALSILNAR